MAHLRPVVDAEHAEGVAAGRQGRHGPAEAVQADGAYLRLLLLCGFWGEHWLSLSPNNWLGVYVTLQSHAGGNFIPSYALFQKNKKGTIKGTNGRVTPAPEGSPALNCEREFKDDKE